MKNIMTGMELEYEIFSRLRALGVAAEKSSVDADLHFGTDLFIAVGDKKVAVGLTCMPCKHKVLKDMEKARRAFDLYIEVYVDTIMVDTDARLDRAVQQMLVAVEFLADKKGFFLVTCEDGSRAKLDCDLQKKMAPVRYAVAY